MKFLKKTSALLLVLLICFGSVFSVSALHSNLHEKNYPLGVADKSPYDDTHISKRPDDVQINTVEYYVGEIGDVDNSAQKGTKQNPYETLYEAITVAKEKRLITTVLYDETAVLNEVVLILVGDTHEAQALPTIDGNILTIIADEGVEATVYVGSSSNIIKNVDFFLLDDKLSPSNDVASDKKGYMELNLGTRDMKGTLTFDCTFYQDLSSNNDASGNYAFIHIGQNSAASVATCNMYNGVTIQNANMASINSNTDYDGELILIFEGTFNMFGGKITRNYIGSIFKILNFHSSGLGLMVYGGEVCDNFARILYTSANNRFDAHAIIYNGVFKNNVTTNNGVIDAQTSNTTQNAPGAVVLYGGTFTNCYGLNSNSFIYSGNTGTFVADYISMESEPFTDLKGVFHEETDISIWHPNGTGSGWTMKAAVFYAQDGTAIGYGYATYLTNASQHRYINDNIRDTSKFEISSVVADEGEFIYTTSGVHYCDEVDGVYTEIEINEKMQSGVYYFGVPSHKEGNLTSIVYPDGFDKEGIKNYECLNCQGEFTDIADIIFTAKGYSIAEDGSAIIGGYTINLDALEEYQDANDTELSYGIMFVNVNGVSDITFTDGKVQLDGKAIQAENLDRTFTQFNFKVSGFNNEKGNYETLKALPLVIAMYVLENDEVSFIQKENSLAYSETEVTINGGETKFKAITLDTMQKNVPNDDTNEE